MYILLSPEFIPKYTCDQKNDLQKFWYILTGK